MPKEKNEKVTSKKSDTKNDLLQNLIESVRKKVKKSGSMTKIDDDTFTEDNAIRIAKRVLYGVHLLTKEDK